MFGIIRPCRHRLSSSLHESWMAHLCGLCLALRNDYGQFARVATNYDGLILSVLVEAQSPRESRMDRRATGPCPLRAMRTAEVSYGEGARLAAAVSLALAAAKVHDHVADRDGAFGLRPVAAGARAVADRWERQSAGAAATLDFDAGVLTDAVSRQAGLEQAAGLGTSVLQITEPTETATAAAFAHTAALAERPSNAAPLAEAGRLFGRLAHLLDAVEDLPADARHGAWNPLTATGTSLAEARRLCRDAVHGIDLALRDVEFTDGELAHRLLVHETGQAVHRVFGRDRAAGVVGSSEPMPSPPDNWQLPDGGEQPDGGQLPDGRPPRRRGLVAGCAAAAFLCCSCQVCCRSEFEGPWSGRKHEGCCYQGVDQGCCDCSGCNGHHGGGGGGDGGCCDGCCCDGCDCCDCNC